MLVKIKAFDIKYKDNTTYLSISGSESLQNYINFGYLTCYDAKSAPNSYTTDLELPDTTDIYDVVLIEARAREKLEQELGLQITSLKISYNLKDII